ncbi:hypothetical protein BDZ89DRAFT_364946 [Hymenopellis radicata]|nr:hypothetical protein BDZ89DRAFT_364946 [Hymenopellis radicata]
MLLWVMGYELRVMGLACVFARNGWWWNVRHSETLLQASPDSKPSRVERRELEPCVGGSAGVRRLLSGTREPATSFVATKRCSLSGPWLPEPARQYTGPGCRKNSAVGCITFLILIFILTISFVHRHHHFQ